MADHHATYNELLSAITELLPRLQARFARYQTENFPQRVPEFFCLELCGEVGELANLEKKHWKGREILSQQYADEAADVLIALINYANARGIELGKAVAGKLATIERIRRERASTGEPY